MRYSRHDGFGRDVFLTENALVGALQSVAGVDPEFVVTVRARARRRI